MLACYYKSDRTVSRLQSGPSAPFLDGFAESLRQKGYSAITIRYHAGAAHHLCCWAAEKGLAPSQLDDRLGQSFLRHLPSCRCSLGLQGRFIHHARFSVPLFIGHLREIGVLAAPKPTEAAPQPLLEGFRHWMLHHRGVAPSTLKLYDRLLPSVLATVADTSRLNAKGLRAFLLERSKHVSTGTLQNEANAVRLFVRYLIAEGKAAPGLDAAIPTVANWRLAALPRCLSSPEAGRLIAACDPSTRCGLRDRAIVLLLIRLGLRASDVRRLRLGDINWSEASLRVSGKGRREARLPLTQEVGDALLAYLERGRPPVAADHVFIRVRPPLLPLGASATVSSIAASAMRRAGIRTPSPGSHVLRHTAARQMLQHGVDLQGIAAVLRHRSLKTTYHYAKVDAALLRLIVQPWPEVPSC